MNATRQRRNQRGRLLGTGLLLLVTMACSGRDRTNARNAVLPTSPSAGGVPFPSSFASRLTTDALRPFPDRQLAFQFRSVNLEQLYRTQLARGVFPTNVNPEGSVIWVSEYLRYRVSGCSAADSFSRILTQIRGGGVPAPCSDSEQPFPDRGDALSFRRQLETVYRNELRAPVADTHVDDEGDVIWTMEYFATCCLAARRTRRFRRSPSRSTVAAFRRIAPARRHRHHRLRLRRLLSRTFR